ncbi:MAG TPA: 4'-phosphopantetheinyl transferase superfamily protein [Stellaceae bacterium]|nr:4'-phosphopantetheinyl transferase superfamily protein [Stellaceae bacterium]
MIERLLPAAVSVVACRGDDPNAVLLAEERPLVEGAVAARLAEFATARHCARVALRRLGVPDGPILRGPKREPIWPEGIVGSLTHCAGFRAAAVARAAEVVTIGIDGEPYEAIPERVRRRVLCEEERAWIASAPASTHWDRLIFSAKESIYKAWFPLARRFLDFDEAIVTIDPAIGVFQARLLVAPPPRLPVELNGRYLIEDGLVLTAVAVMR